MNQCLPLTHENGISNSPNSDTTPKTRFGERTQLFTDKTFQILSLNALKPRVWWFCFHAVSPYLLTYYFAYISNNFVLYPNHCSQNFSQNFSPVSFTLQESLFCEFQLFVCWTPNLLPAPVSLPWHPTLVSPLLTSFHSLFFFFSYHLRSYNPYSPHSILYFEPQKQRKEHFSWIKY